MSGRLKQLDLLYASLRTRLSAQKLSSSSFFVRPQARRLSTAVNASAVPSDGWVPLSTHLERQKESLPALESPPPVASTEQHEQQQVVHSAQKRFRFNQRALASVIKLAQRDPDDISSLEFAKLHEKTMKTQPLRTHRHVSHARPLLRSSPRSRKQIRVPKRNPQEWMPHESKRLVDILRPMVEERGEDIDWEALKEEHFPTRSSLDLYSHATYDLWSRITMHSTRNPASVKEVDATSDASVETEGKETEGDAKRRQSYEADTAPWTREELHRLDYYVERFAYRPYDQKWHAVAQAMHNVRSEKVYELKWTTSLQHMPLRRWHPKEDAILLQVARRKHATLPLQRSYKEKMARYFYLLREQKLKAHSVKWSKEEVLQVMDTAKRHGRGLNIIIEELKQKNLLNAKVHGTYPLRRLLALLNETRRSPSKAPALQQICSFPVEELPLSEWHMPSSQWSAEESQKLLKAVEKYGVNRAAFMWISAEVGRSFLSCWCHYYRVLLRPSVRKIDTLSRYKMVKCVERFGRKFAYIHKTYLPDIPPERIRSIINLEAKFSIEERIQKYATKLKEEGEEDKMRAFDEELIRKV